MKKIITSLVLLLAFSWSATAQDFGLKAGLSYSSLNGEVAENSSLKGKAGFYAGAFLEIPMGDIFAIRPEVVYSQQGAKWTYKILGKEFTETLNMNYVNVPLLAKVKIGNFGILGGVQCGFLTGKPSVKYSSGESSLEIDKKAYATFDFGVAGGLEVAFSEHFLIDLRYTHGLVNTFDKNNTSLKNVKLSEKNDFKNGVVSLGVGFKF